MGNNIDIQLVHAFIQIVKYGSFTRAAATMKIPKSTLSKSLARLEAETGTQLLLRTTRSQTLTAAGRAFYDACVGPIQTIEDAQKSISGNDSVLAGTIRITAPEDLGTEVIAPYCGEISRKHPKLNFDLQYTDQILDLVRDGYDLAIRIGHLKESALKARKVGEVKLILVASPDYLKDKGKIHRPDDLKDLDCLNLSGTKTIWPLRSTMGSTSRLNVQPRITSNHMSSLIRAAIAGAGIALVPGFLARHPIANGDLVRVLPNWKTEGLPVHILSPLSFSSSARIRIVSDELLPILREALEV